VTEPVPGLDDAALERLAATMATAGLCREDERLGATLISGGRSNITYAIESSQGSWVLRRPPLGHVLSTAHDMGREYRIMRGLGRSEVGVPVPEVVLVCDEPDVLGAGFYVMRRVVGDVLRTADQALSLSPDRQVAVCEELIDILAALHVLDPASVGLEDFGRPEGFMPRQVARWTRQLADSRSREIDGIERLADELRDSVPQQLYASIVHGDYRLDNCLVRDGSIAAVLDWEMSTLGDPLSDLALFGVYYGGLRDIDNPVVQALDGLGSYPSLDELLQRYARTSGHDLTGFDWYNAFAWFKLAVILEGIHFRSTLGATVGDGFEGVAELVQPCVDRGLGALARVSAG
jgi:aminoglycoside phosphotransferase (APT) family kinase protein